MKEGKLIWMKHEHQGTIESRVGCLLHHPLPLHPPLPSSSPHTMAFFTPTATPNLTHTYAPFLPPPSSANLSRRWTEQDVELASTAAIHFVKAFYKSMDNVVERLPVGPSSLLSREAGKG